MQYFLDSADLAQIADAIEKYPVDGVTTNPAIISRDLPNHMALTEYLAKISALVGDRLLFVQTTSTDTESMVRDAYKILGAVGGNLSIKIPATPDGITAIKRLSSDNICVTATAVYSTSQAMLAAKAGASYVAPYISHIDNLSADGVQTASEMAQMLRQNGLYPPEGAFSSGRTGTQVLAASFRTAGEVDRVIRGGVTSVTITAEMFRLLASHPGTAQELSSFGSKWNARFDGGIYELLDGK